MTVPPPCARRWAAAAWVQAKTLVRSVSTTARHSAAVSRGSGRTGCTAALFTSAVSPPPDQSRVSRTRRWQASSSVRSARSTTARPPAARIRSAVSPAAAVAVRQCSATAAPCSAKRSAMARPMPPPAPVTRAVCPSRRFMGGTVP